jgi:hypothetical protein
MQLRHRIWRGEKEQDKRKGLRQRDGAEFQTGIAVGGNLSTNLLRTYAPVPHRAQNASRLDASPSPTFLNAYTATNGNSNRNDKDEQYKY